MKRKFSIISMLIMILTFSILLVGCTSTDEGSNGESEQGGIDNENVQDFQVELDPNGGIFQDGTKEGIILDVKEGSAIDFGSNMATMEGNELRGWYFNDGSPWPGARKVTDNLSLSAKWSEEEIQEVFPLELKLGGDLVPLSSDSGVYQFTVVSTIYSGYAQRSGLYTIYMDDLQVAIDADDGTEKRALIKFESNYVDTTGGIYGIVYNDGEIELFYDYLYSGERTIYLMDTIYWTLDGYISPFEGEPKTETEGTSMHSVYDTSFLGEASTIDETAEVSADEIIDIVTFVEEPFISFDATESETMKLKFCANGVATIYMTTYDANIDIKYLWTYSEDGGLIVNYNGGNDNVITIAEDGDTCIFSDAYENVYEFSLTALLEAMPERVEIYRATASNSETMFTFFYQDQGIGLMFDLTEYGQEGEFHTIASGQWEYNDEVGLSIAINGILIEFTKKVDGNLEFTFDGNTYIVVVDELLATLN